jgi:predicted ATPase
LARLDRLGPAAREAAQVGAAIGREFPHELLAAVADRGEAELAAALDQLAGAGLVTRRGVPPGASYLFKHALVQDAAYGMLLRDRRRRLHGRIARALEERSPELAETAPEVIAHHLSEAGEAERAVGYWLKAGRRSAERSAEREAARQLRRGLEALATLPPSAERDRLELDFQLALGPRLVSTSSYANPEVAAAYERASALCESLDDAGRLRSVLFGQSVHHMVRGECRAALSFAERLRASAERGGGPAERLLGHRTLGAALMQLGLLEDARSELEAAFALHDPRRDRSLAASYNVDPYASALGFFSLVLWMMGFPQQAERAAREAIRSAAELGHASTTSLVRVHAGAHLAALLLDARAAELHADAVIAEAEKHHIRAWWGTSAVLRGWALARNGRTREGLALARQGLALTDALGDMWHAPRRLVLLAEIHARLGQFAEALGLVKEAQARVRRTGERLWEADVHRAEGELRHLAGAPDAEVEACFAAALAVARRQEARSFELRAATSPARCWAERHERRTAHDLLAPVYGRFTEGLDTADLVEAMELLDDLASAPQAFSGTVQRHV